MKKEKTISCKNFEGKIVDIPQSKFYFRPAAYAIVQQDESILVAEHKISGTYMLPGGGIEIGESSEKAVVREVKEETSISVQVKGLFRTTENFFYYDPTDDAIHGVSFFYICEPLDHRATINNKALDENEVSDAFWIQKDDIQPEKFLDLFHTILTNYLQSPKIIEKSIWLGN